MAMLRNALAVKFTRSANPPKKTIGIISTVTRVKKNFPQSINAIRNVLIQIPPFVYIWNESPLLTPI